MQEKVIIIGGGLGGLLCGAILAKNNYNVTVIDQNKQIGGCLQSFSVNKHLFDSCVHYIGGLNKGNTLYKILDYVDVMDYLTLEPYSDIVEHIYIKDDPTPYPIAQGYDKFKKYLLQYFPDSENALDLYIEKIKETIQKFPLYKLQNGDPNLKFDVLGVSLEEELNAIFGSSKLKEVILGNSLLYAGAKKTTPFYVHALIMNSYIESSYKIKGSSAQIAKALVQTIRKFNGLIVRNEKITKVTIEQERITSVSSDHENYHGTMFISAVHPKSMYKLLETQLIKSNTRNRINTYPNSIASFMVNIVLKKKTIEYNESNIYWNQNDALSTIAENQQNWPNNYAIYFTKDENAPNYCESLSILCYMDTKVFEAYNTSFNTKALPNERPNPYITLKERFADRLITKAAQHIPNLQSAIEHKAIATPLTFKDYMGTDDGSMYGMLANYEQPMQSLLSVNCKIPNLLFTGQNVNLHGVLGVSITAVSTCASILGIDNLLNEINNTK